MFSALSPLADNFIHGIISRYNADPRPEKMDLGVGVFRTPEGKSPVMDAIAKAEATLLRLQTSKSYLSMRGHPQFLEAMSHLVFGNKSTNQLIASIQTVGGTGGLRLALQLALLANPDVKLLIGTPTWPIYFSICKSLGIDVFDFKYFDQPSQTLLFENMQRAVTKASPGDLLLLQGPCHNPTGEDLTDDQLTDILQLADLHGISPLVDAAYYGWGQSLDADLKRVAKIFFSSPNAMLVMSCSKAFSLYRERVGLLFVATPDRSTTNIVQANIMGIARNLYSMPPAHGAAAVAQVLGDEAFVASWRMELDGMNRRIKDVRRELAVFGASIPALSAIDRQIGIFSLLPISSTTTATLAKDHAIYLTARGRINVAGLKTGHAKRFCDALACIDQ